MGEVHKPGPRVRSFILRYLTFLRFYIEGSPILGPNWSRTSPVIICRRCSIDMKINRCLCFPDRPWRLVAKVGHSKVKPLVAAGCRFWKRNTAHCLNVLEQNPRRVWPFVDWLVSFRLDMTSSAAFKESSNINLGGKKLRNRLTLEVPRYSPNCQSSRELRWFFLPGGIWVQIPDSLGSIFNFVIWTDGN